MQEDCDGLCNVFSCEQEGEDIGEWNYCHGIEQEHQPGVVIIKLKSIDQTDDYD